MLPLDKALIGRLRASFVVVRTNGHLLGSLFYDKLFAAAPQLRPLFKNDPESQAMKLVHSLDAVIRNLEDPSANAAMLAELGRRHVGYGAKPEHYELVVSLLTESIRELLGKGPDERCIDEWHQALTLVSRQMIAASGPVKASQDAL
jgi:nitric oxide dioxygenase